MLDFLRLIFVLVAPLAFTASVLYSLGELVGGHIELGDAGEDNEHQLRS
jgi:hypothetical protein